VAKQAVNLYDKLDSDKYFLNEAKIIAVTAKTELIFFRLAM
jgi:hypothetical protein